MASRRNSNASVEGALDLNPADDVERDTGIRGRNSNFYLNVKNTLGIESIKARADLKNFALVEPGKYTEMRARVYMDVVSSMVQANYDTIWDLLSEGSYRTEKGMGYITIGSGSAEKPYSPNLPDPEIAKVANGFAEAVMKAFDDVISKVLPDNYREMAESKIRATTDAKGLGDAL